MPTIVPLVLEDQWQPFLAEVPIWNPPLSPTLILSPHPDDETLGAGGLVTRLRSQGIAVSVVAVTDGENAYAGTSALAATRIAEQTEALARLGVPSTMIHRFHLPDRDVASHEEELVGRLRPLLSDGMHVLAPWTRDFHPDHEAVGRAAARAAQSMHVYLTNYLFWTWHRGTPELLEKFCLAKIPLTPPEVETKLYALQAHSSQFEHGNEEPILNRDLVAPAARPYEVYIR